MNDLPETYEWRMVSDIQVNDRVHRWGYDLVVTSVRHDGDIVYLTVNDEGTIQTWDYYQSSEIICERRKR